MAEKAIFATQRSNAEHPHELFEDRHATTSTRIVDGLPTDKLYCAISMCSTMRPDSAAMVLDGLNPIARGTIAPSATNRPG